MTHTLEAPRTASVPFASLAAALMGQVLLPGSEAYERTCPVWNAAVDLRPAAIAQPLNAWQVALAVRFAREHGLPLAVRSGGHSPAGYGTVGGGLVIDLSRMRAISVDPLTRHVRIEPGLTWGEVAQALHPHGLALTSGDTATVGVGGLTLGGGIGWFARKYGLALDRLRAVELVTADGKMLRASAGEHSELFWALRGGGGNFGVATAFEFEAHEGGTVLGGAVFYDASDPDTLALMLHAYAESALHAPDALSTQAIVIAAPPAPFVPAEAVGRPLLGILVCCAGDLAAAEAVVAPLRGLGPVVADLVGPMPYPAMFSLAEVGEVRGLGHFSRSMFLNDFGAPEAGALAREALATVHPGSLVQLRALGGAMGRVAPEATAFAHRDKHFMLMVSNFSPDRGEAAALQGATDRVWGALRPRDLGTYGNFVGLAEAGRERDVYPGERYGRLGAVKRAYDPHNVFARNVNVRP